jgi:hypothetical protein
MPGQTDKLWAGSMIRRPIADRAVPGVHSSNLNPRSPNA